MIKKAKSYHVEPLRTEKEIEEMKWAIKRGSKNTPKRQSLADRDVLIFLLGINTGLRVNDIVQIKVGDVKSRKAFYVHEGKTNKRRKINFGMIQKDVESFIDGKQSNEYLFKSQKGSNAISTTQVYRILNDAATFLGRNDIGTHTMRKTFGYHHYKQFKDVAILQDIFNHSLPSITMRYIGMRKDEINISLENFRLG